MVSLCAFAVGQNTQTIADIAGNNPDFSLVVAAATAAEVGDILSQDQSNNTVFAPTNAAFLTTVQDLGYQGENLEQAFGILAESFPVEVGGGLIVTLRDVLSYHIVPGRLNSQAVTAREALTTLDNGQSFQVNGLTLVDLAEGIPNPNLIESSLDIKASNGIIHAIDRVLLPFDAPNDLFADVTPIPVEETPTPTDEVSETEPAVPTDDPSASPGASPSDTPAETPGGGGPTPAPTVSPGDGAGDVSPENGEDGGDDEICFPASAVVHTDSGVDVEMTRVAAGHNLHVSEDGIMSPVYFFSHRQYDGLHEFVRVRSDKGHAITLSPKHYLYANGVRKAAQVVKVGDVLRTLDGDAKVVSVENVKDRGLVAPHTMHGDIVVNRVVASTYTAVVHPQLAHILLSPIRAVARMGIAKEPLGSVMYDGASRLAKVVPSGPLEF